MPMLAPDTLEGLTEDMGERFDELCDKASEVYLEMSELPMHEEVDGVVVHSFSTTIDAAEQTLGAMALSDKLAAVHELAVEQTEFSINYGLIDDTEKSKTMAEILDDLLTYVVAISIEHRPAIWARQESNRRTYDFLPKDHGDE